MCDGAAQKEINLANETLPKMLMGLQLHITSEETEQCEQI